MKKVILFLMFSIVFIPTYGNEIANLTLEDAKQMTIDSCNGWWDEPGYPPWNCDCVINRIFETNTDEENKLFIFKWTFLQNHTSNYNKWVEWNKMPESEQVDEIETRATKYCIENYNLIL